MKRWMNLGGAAATALVLCVLTVRAQEPGPEPAPDGEASREEWEEHAAEAAEHAAAAAEAAAERVAEQAERIAQRAAEQAEAAADQAAAAAEQAAAQVELAVEQAVEHSADIQIAADPFGGAGAGVIFGDGPKDVFLRGVKRERRAADPETIKLLEMDRKLGRRIAELAAKYKGLDDDGERKAAAEELAARVTDQFTVRQQMRERELGELEDQVKRLRELQDKRASQIEQIVGDRVQQLLREADGLGWGDGGGEGLGWGGDVGKFEFAIQEGMPAMIAAPGAPAKIAAPKAVKRLIIRGPDVEVTPPVIKVPAPAKQPK